MDEERRAWTPEQERWRGGVEANLRSLESRHKDLTLSISGVYGKMSEIERNADIQRQRMEDKIDAINKAVIASEAALQERIAKSEGKLMTVWIVGGAVFAIVMAGLQWVLASRLGGHP